MDEAKPGHTVEFHGLKGAAHLNGTKGTLVEFLKKEQRWSVRCQLDNKKVKAKPDNLILQRHVGSGSGRPIIGGDYTPEQASRHFVATTIPSSGFLPTGGLPTGGLPIGGPTINPSGWAKGLSQKDQYEWFSNCYQMRCDDDYQWGGGNLHGPYDPEATPQSIADDFLVYCLLAHRSKAVPQHGWDWPAFLRIAANLVAFAFEKSDAKERWGSENVFQAHMGGRSLRFTGMEIYKSPVDQPVDSPEHLAAERVVQSNNVEELKNQVGGTEAWATFVEDLGRCRRFA